jgi:hypothetical protein
MATSQARIDANRRNAKLSTGARTEEGRRRSSQNAYRHGMRCRAPVAANEDPLAYQERMLSVSDTLGPRNAVEALVVRQIVNSSWAQDRISRAQTARLSTMIEDDARREREAVLSLGQRLFSTKGELPIEMWGLINFYHAGERASRSSNQDDVNNPAKLVRELSSTVAGCDWLLQQFAELRELLEFDNAWEGHHKLKCIRLLGRSPLDCANVREVAEIFVATWSIRSVRSGVYSELRSELGPIEYKRFTKRVRRIWKNMMNALDLDNSRRILVSIVERAMARVRAQSAVARERAARDAQRRADCLLFDDSMEGERLRRYEASSSRTMLRSISEFFKVRRATEDGDFEPSLEAAATVETENGQAVEQDWHPETDSFDLGEPIDQGNTIEQNFANEPNAATGQNFANEPNAATEQNFANEPNAACEQNCANEPNAASAQNLDNEPIYERGVVKRGGADFVSRAPAHPLRRRLRSIWPISDLSADEVVVLPATHPLSPRPREIAPPRYRHCSKR